MRDSLYQVLLLASYSSINLGIFHTISAKLVILLDFQRVRLIINIDN